MEQDKSIYKSSIKISFSSKEQNKSKVQKQISNILKRNGSLKQC